MGEMVGFGGQTMAWNGWSGRRDGHPIGCQWNIWDALLGA